MCEKNELKSFTDKKLRNNQNRSWQPAPPPFSPGLVHVEPGTVLQGHRDSLKRQQDLLHDEIKRGKEYLRRVQNDLDTSRASLEQWNRYEMISSAHPLDHLIQTMALQEKTQQFLVGWLGRQQERLAKVREDIECASQQVQRRKPSTPHSQRRYYVGANSKRSRS